MNKAILGTLGVVVVLGALGFFLWGGQGSGIPAYKAPSAKPPGAGVTGALTGSADPFDVTITYTDKGFSPIDTTIAQGTRVRFINKSSDTFWPASGVHPTHTLYPEKEATDCLGSSFDACKALAPGEFYDFTFYYVGHWPFHDHLHAYNTGSVTVVASTTTL